MWNNWIDTSDFRALNTYEKAYERWQSAPEWAGSRHAGERRLKKNRQDIHGIRRLPDTSIACRYHATDVVTFHPGGSITLDPYQSNCTTLFANALLPDDLFVDFNNHVGLIVACHTPNAPGYCWEREARVYELKGRATTFEKREDGWWPRDPEKTTSTFDWPRVNRKRARAALLAHDFARFRLWVQTAAMIGATHEWAHQRAFNSYDLLMILGDRTEWPNLLRNRAYYPDADYAGFCFGRELHRWGGKLTLVERTAIQIGRIVRAVRMAIYEDANVVDVEVLPYLQKLDDLRAFESACRTYDWV